MAEEEIVDSPREMVSDHLRRYLSTDGDDGYLWRGSPTLLLTTRGRKTGKLRRTALIFGQRGEDCVVVGSRGGADAHPQWFLNLSAEPEVVIQIKGAVHRGRARIATGPERAQLWKLMCSIYPSYEEYQQKTSREIPVVVIETVRS